MRFASAPPPPPSPPEANSPILQLVGWIGMVTSTCAVAGPLPTMRRICRAESTGEFSQLPYLMAVWQGGLWVMYMLPVVPHVGEWTLMQPLAANAVNVCVNTIYNLIYIRHSRSRWRAAGRLAAVFAANGAISAFALIEAPTLPIPLWPNPSQTKQTTTLGIACTVLQVGMYAAPLSIVHRVVRTRSVKYMPLAISVTWGVNSGMWTAYALLSSPVNEFILIPNGLGFVLSLVSLLIYRCFAPFWGAAPSKATMPENAPAAGARSRAASSQHEALLRTSES